MKFLQKAKDGGPESTVAGYWLIEIKWLFSIVLLRFDHGTRDAYHTHAFSALSWVLRGKLTERERSASGYYPDRYYRASWRPIYTRREYLHQVKSTGTTWVLSIRGPWTKTWYEIDANGERLLSHGRKVVLWWR